MRNKTSRPLNEQKVQKLKYLLHMQLETSTAKSFAGRGRKVVENYRFYRLDDTASRAGISAGAPIHVVNASFRGFIIEESSHFE